MTNLLIVSIERHLSPRTWLLRDSFILCLESNRETNGGDWNLRSRKLDATAEAFLMATACSDAPGGRSEWRMQLLADRLVELGVVESISDETVRQTLKKMTSNPG